MRCQTVMMLVLTGAMLTGAFLPHPRLHLWSPGRAPQSHTAVMTEGSSEAMRTVEVGLGERAYPIYIGSGILGPENSELVRQHVKGRKVLIVTNDRIAPLWLSRCEATFRDSGDLDIETLVVPDGEAHKTMDTIMMIMQKALESRMDRKSTFIALGGGVIGDMVGFAAATYQRGVNFIQIPTTLMAMVDSSVGGKTGVNHPLGKNMIGSFHQPQCVLIDTETLSTLPDREFFSGISEVVKYGLIRDARFFQWQEANMDALVQRDDDTVARAVELSCVNKVGESDFLCRSVPGRSLTYAYLRRNNHHDATSRRWPLAPGGSCRSGRARGRGAGDPQSGPHLWPCHRNWNGIRELASR